MSTKPAESRFTLQLVAAYALGIVPGAVLLIFLPSGEHVRWWGFWLGLTVGAVYWWLTVRILTRALRHWEHKGLLLAILLPYQLWTGCAFVSFCNRGLDSSAATPHMITVLKHEKRTKGNDQLVVQHWREGEAPFGIEGYHDAGTVLLVQTHEGAWGLEWIEMPPALLP